MLSRFFLVVFPIGWKLLHCLSATLSNNIVYMTCGKMDVGILDDLLFKSKEIDFSCILHQVVCESKREREGAISPGR